MSEPQDRPAGYDELQDFLRIREERMPPPLQLQPIRYTEEQVAIFIGNAVEDARIERESYARHATFITWVAVTLFTAIGAWVLHQDLFIKKIGISRDLIPFIAVAANGLMWLCMTRWFWFWKRRRRSR